MLLTTIDPLLPLQLFAIITANFEQLTLLTRRSNPTSIQFCNLNYLISLSKLTKPKTLFRTIPLSSMQFRSRYNWNDDIYQKSHSLEKGILSKSVYICKKNPNKSESKAKLDPKKESKEKKRLPWRGIIRRKKQVWERFENLFFHEWQTVSKLTGR